MGIVGHAGAGGAGVGRTVTVPAYVQVSRAPRGGRLAAMAVAEVLLVCTLILGLVFGVTFSLLAVVLVLWLARAIRAEAATSEPRVVPVGVTAGPGGVVVEMPGARLWSGRYVDQRYSCAAAAVEGAGMDETGAFRLRARVLASEAVEGGVVLERREHECGEVSFRPISAEGAAALRSAFER